MGACWFLKLNCFVLFKGFRTGVWWASVSTVSHVLPNSWEHGPTGTPARGIWCFRRKDQLQVQGQVIPPSGFYPCFLSLQHYHGLLSAVSFLYLTTNVIHIVLMWCVHQHWKHKKLKLCFYFFFLLVISCLTSHSTL